MLGGCVCEKSIFLLKALSATYEHCALFNVSGINGGIGSAIANGQNY